MSADEHLHPDQITPKENPWQMKLFIDPEEHMQSLVGSVDLFGGETWSSLWDYKTEESKADYGHGAGLHRSLSEEGFNWERTDPPGRGWRGSSADPTHKYAPVAFPSSSGTTPGWVQGEGHHRVAAAAAIQRETGVKQWLPIHYEDWSYPANRSTKVTDRSSLLSPRSWTDASSD